MAKHDPAMAQLARLVTQTIASFGDQDTTNRLITERVMPDALKIVGLRAEDMTRQVVARVVGEQLRRPGKRDTPDETRPVLRGLEALTSLPMRIVVPWLGVDPDEENEGGVWRVLHRCTLGDLKANILMRQQMVDGVLAGINVMERVRDVVLANGGGDDDVIADVLGITATA
jgi:hypothetical protein